LAKGDGGGFYERMVSFRIADNLSNLPPPLFAKEGREKNGNGVKKNG